MNLDETKRAVLGIITDLANQVPCDLKHQLNERYIHHTFSHRAQENLGMMCLPLDGSKQNNLFHTEWPTWKKGAGLRFRKYRKEEDNRYRPNSNGKAGFIDFAFGPYASPDIGIEFSLKYGWSHEEVVFDLLKLMDGKLPFQLSVSHNIVLRENGLSTGEYLRRLESRMLEAVDQARQRLGSDLCDNSRRLWFVVSEISPQDRRHWCFDRSLWRFREGLQKEM